jgi:L-histidine Nalpha-methyltransferase
VSAPARITIHPSQFPESVRRDLLASLRSRKVNHKFHYDSLKQTQKWLALHQAYSPSRTDPDCAAAYDRSFAEAVAQLPTRPVHLIGLGCGGGQKDTRLLKLLRAGGRQTFYTPSDVSAAMVLVARKAASAVIPEANCFPFVCDLATAHDLPRALEAHWRDALPGSIHATRLLTFFGMMPNFEPHLVLPRLAALIRRGDCLLLSANLAPGPDYAAGIQKVLPLYDNALTRDWLTTFLFDLGVAKSDGRTEFTVEEAPIGSGLRRMAAHFRFTRACEIRLDDQQFTFHAGESIRLFFSYRHTPAQVCSLLGAQGLRVLDQWITKSGEEGVFLVRRGSR